MGGDKSGLLQTYNNNGTSFIYRVPFMLIYICMHNIVTMALLMSNVNGDFKMGIKQEDDFKL